MRRFLFPLVLLSLLIVSRESLNADPEIPPSTLSQGTMWNALAHHQQEELSSGKPVVLEEAVEGNAWPRYTVYYLVKASAAQSAAVFWDCELDPKYIPNCLSVQITAKPQEWIIEAEYKLKMPMMLPNEVYVSRNELKLPFPETYEISWNVLHACYIKGSRGNIRIESIGSDGGCERTLIRYTNLVMPGSSIAVLLKSTARSQVIASVNGLVNQIENEISNSPQQLEQQVQQMDRGLEALKKSQSSSVPK